MHEMSLCESIVQTLEQEARAQQFNRVKTVWLEIGMLAGVETDAMRFCFDVVTNGTLAAGAALEIDELPGQGWCLQCEKTVAMTARYDTCPECGGAGLMLTAGDEMRIKEVEVE
ncbi:hydrogenase maturation nickel metallochaperone HypA [Parasalinivibrio latis]|uniref:hydrogenase maturation nickel metallochaperone HypA n=1 Tax=Parasalinivibrio latis TaxID=2952610 RepID=UPI0030E3DC22